jgi:hypothetical protein
MPSLVVLTRNDHAHQMVERSIPSSLRIFHAESKYPSTGADSGDPGPFKAAIANYHFHGTCVDANIVPTFSVVKNEDASREKRHYGIQKIETNIPSCGHKHTYRSQKAQKAQKAQKTILHSLHRRKSTWSEFPTGEKDQGRERKRRERQETVFYIGTKTGTTIFTGK